MSKRSFEKIRDLPFRKDIKPGHGVGREFDELVKDNKQKFIEIVIIRTKKDK